MPYATHGEQTLRATARNSAYYLLRDLRDPVNAFADVGGGFIPSDRGYFSGRAAGSEIASGGSNSSGRDYVLTRHLLLFVTATFLLDIYFLALYMGPLYIIFHFLVGNIGCGMDKAFLDLL